MLLSDEDMSQHQQKKAKHRKSKQGEAPIRLPEYQLAINVSSQTFVTDWILV
jgi:hypothetical protein